MKEKRFKVNVGLERLERLVQQDVTGWECWEMRETEAG